MSFEDVGAAESQGGEPSHERGVWAERVQGERERRRADALDQIASAAFECTERRALWERLVRACSVAFSLDVALLRVRSEAGWQLAAQHGIDERQALAFSPAVEHELARGGPELAPLRLSEPAANGNAERTGLSGDIRTLFALPLVALGQLQGVMYLGFRDERDLQHERPLLDTVAAHIAGAIAQRETIEALTRAVRSRDDVLSVVAHDLQNPITVISIAANMLLQRLPDATARRPIERILRGAQRADRMIRDLLEVNAIESGRFSVELRRLQPADLILSVLESQQSLAADASVIIATDVAPELPEIDADEERMLEVLENLISNAVKFTGPGGTITVSAASREDKILVCVKDTGSGITPDQLPHIFDRFWQATKAQRRGTGLGLTICKAIVEAHGGQIWAESSPGVGTSVLFTIPAASARPKHEGPTEVANILLVDDRPENLVALSAILDRPDYRVVTATSGEEALRVALKERFSVALIDIAMPGMNGLEVAVHLKELERSRDIPIIFVTAFGDDPEEIHRAYSAGGADYLVKPLDAEIVRKKVAVFVELSRKREGGERITGPE